QLQILLGGLDREGRERIEPGESAEEDEVRVRVEGRDLKELAQQWRLGIAHAHAEAAAAVDEFVEDAADGEPAQRSPLGQTGAETVALDPDLRACGCGLLVGP